MISASSKTTRRSKVGTQNSSTLKTDKTLKNVSSKLQSPGLSSRSKSTKSLDSTFKASWITYGKTLMKRQVRSKQRSKARPMNQPAHITLTILLKPMYQRKREVLKYLERKAHVNPRGLRLISLNYQRTLSITTSKNVLVSSLAHSKRHRIRARKMFFVTISQR